MLVVNILSSSLYLPLVLLSIIINYKDEDAIDVAETDSQVNLVQTLLLESVSHFVGALSVLSTLCTGL